MKSLYCPKCDNAERFNVGVKEYKRWIVDGQGNYLVDSADAWTDSEMNDDFQCEDCGEWVSKVEFCEGGCGKPKDKCACHMSVSHETKVRVSMSFYVDIATESHPLDIPKNAMDEIVCTEALAYLKQLQTMEDVGPLVDEYDYEEVKMTEE